MRENYEVPIIEVIKFENADSVIMMSSIDNDFDDDGSLDVQIYKQFGLEYLISQPFGN